MGISKQWVDGDIDLMPETSVKCSPAGERGREKEREGERIVVRERERKRVRGQREPLGQCDT